MIKTKTAIAASALFVTCMSTVATADIVNLGQAGNFNAFIFGDMNYYNSDVEGALAVGGNLSMTSMGVASSLPHSNDYNLVVGGNLDWTNGQLFSGSAIYAGTANLNNIGFPNGSAVQGNPPFSFTDEQNYLTQVSGQWANLAANGLVSNNWGTLTLDSVASGLNVFSVDATELASVHGLVINADSNSTVLINVNGSTASMQNFGFTLSGGVTSSKVLFNFADATSLTMSGIGVKASILAPHAEVNFQNGHMDGTLIAMALAGNGEFHHVPFSGDLPSVPTPGSLALLTMAGLIGKSRRRSNN